MKKYIAVLAGGVFCLLSLADSCPAQEDYWSVSAANWMQYWYFEDSFNFAEARRDSLDNRFIVDFDLGDFYAGVWLRILQLNRPDESSEETTQRYFGWRQNGFNIHAGNFYQVFDRGLTLNTFIDDNVYYDNNLDGIKASGLYDRFDFDFLSARGLESTTGERDYIFRGARGAVRPVDPFKIGFSYVRFKRNDFMNVNRSLNSNITGFNSRFVMGPIDLYGEYAVRRGKKPNPFTEGNGDGTYLSASLVFEKISLFSEYKNIINLIYPNPQNRFNAPPPASHSGRTLTDLAGAPGERGYQVGILISPTFDLNFEFAYSEAFSRSTPVDYYLGEKFAGVRWSATSDLIMNYSWDRIDYAFGFSGEDEIENYFDAYYYWRYNVTLSLAAFTRRFIPEGSEDYHENYLTLGFGLANKFQLNLGGSTSNWDTNPEGDPKKLAFIELTVRFPNHELVIFNGGERGGLICSSGICQSRPTFQGTRIVLFSRF
ncbi:MAG: hypothetical protein JSW64_03175 [Candidatus Zixiibacteriota bacterium]|nr:MAG: hypothetical protein JSW64_03175 [candidate division Zixibacteria bacterium]